MVARSDLVIVNFIRGPIGQVFMFRGNQPTKTMIFVHLIVGGFLLCRGPVVNIHIEHKNPHVLWVSCEVHLHASFPDYLSTMPQY